MEEPAVVEPNLFEVLATQRAMRRLKPDPVPEPHIRKLIWAATRAPNGANRQGWRFVVLTEPGKKRRLQELYLASFERAAVGAVEQALKVLPPDQAASLQRAFLATQWQAQHLHEVPVIILACSLPASAEGPLTGGSIYPAVENLLLAARALGLGACMTTIVSEHQPEVRALLGIPNDVAIAAQIPVGWPAVRFGPVRRRPPEQVTFWDQWDRTTPN